MSMLCALLSADFSIFSGYLQLHAISSSHLATISMSRILWAYWLGA